ncbi:MAG: hypothetical protein AB7H71_05095 [Alphaproteobacteria bacterium]
MTSLALAAGCALALAIPAAQAQQTRVFTTGPQPTQGDFSASAARNNAESAQYERLLQTNRAFREARMRKECGPITDAQLHQSCLASFARYEPRGFEPSQETASTSANQMTGGSTGSMTSTTGATGYNSDMYGAGSDIQPSRTEQGYYRVR